MKIRNGFVSNSSSSSFIVKIGYSIVDKIMEEREPVASKEDIKKLEKYGFKKSNITSPFDKIKKPYCEISEEEKYLTGEKFVSMRYYVSCNQDEVICFLVKNNIPFKASCHYDNEYVSFKKDSDYIFEAENYGIAIDMYGEDRLTFEGMEEKEPIRKVSVKEYLENNSHWENEDNED